VSAPIALGALLLFNATAARADVVLQWDEIAVRTLTTQTPGLTPFAQARFAAIVQLAVFEAVNSITGKYEGYLGSAPVLGSLLISAPPGASPEAAAIQAAYRVLFNYFGSVPANATALNADLATSLGAIPNGAAKTAGIAVGEAAGGSPHRPARRRWIESADELPASATARSRRMGHHSRMSDDPGRHPAGRRFCSTGATSNRSAFLSPPPAIGTNRSGPRLPRR
jgi:hypothetical protein